MTLAEQHKGERGSAPPGTAPLNARGEVTPLRPALSPADVRSVSLRRTRYEHRRAERLPGEVPALPLLIGG
jgi:hypothetical protein